MVWVREGRTGLACSLKLLQHRLKYWEGRPSPFSKPDKYKNDLSLTILGTVASFNV